MWDHFPINTTPDALPVALGVVASPLGHCQCRTTPSVGLHSMLCSIRCLACRKSRVMYVCSTYVQPHCDHNIPPLGTTPTQRSMTRSYPPVCRCSAPNPHVLTSRESSPFLAPSLYTHIPTQHGEIVVDPQGTFSFSCLYTGAQCISRQPTFPIHTGGMIFFDIHWQLVAQTRCHTGTMKQLT